MTLALNSNGSCQGWTVLFGSLSLTHSVWIKRNECMERFIMHCWDIMHCMEFFRQIQKKTVKWIEMEREPRNILDIFVRLFYGHILVLSSLYLFNFNSLLMSRLCTNYWLKSSFGIHLLIIRVRRWCFDFQAKSFKLLAKARTSNDKNGPSASVRFQFILKTGLFSNFSISSDTNIAKKCLSIPWASMNAGIGDWNERMQIFLVDFFLYSN